MIVGISGKRRSGKDTIAQRLVERHGFTRLSLADPLKLEVKRILGRTLEAYVHERHGDLCAAGLCGDVAAEIDRLIYTDRTAVTRALLQEWGTELRRHEDSEYWVKAWMRAATPLPRVVCADVRFPNEAEAVRALGGKLVRVARPDLVLADANADTHASETALDHWTHWDCYFINDSSIADLWAKVDLWMSYAEAQPCQLPSPSTTV